MEVAEAEVAEVAFAVAAVVPAVAGEALAQGEEEVDSEEGAEASEANLRLGHELGHLLEPNVHFLA